MMYNLIVIRFSLDKIEAEISAATSTVNALEKKKTSAKKALAQNEKEVKNMELHLAKMPSEEDLKQFMATAEERKIKASREVMEKTDVVQTTNFEASSLRNRHRYFIKKI